MYDEDGVILPYAEMIYADCPLSLTKTPLKRFFLVSSCRGFADIANFTRLLLLYREWWAQLLI